jgi:hypothetical protein
MFFQRPGVTFSGRPLKLPPTAAPLVAAHPPVPWAG